MSLHSQSIALAAASDVFVSVMVVVYAVDRSWYLGCYARRVQANLLEPDLCL